MYVYLIADVYMTGAMHVSVDLMNPVDSTTYLPGPHATPVPSPSPHLIMNQQQQEQLRMVSNNAMMMQANNGLIPIHHQDGFSAKSTKDESNQSTSSYCFDQIKCDYGEL